ncbi:MAG TPA: glycosyltransferase family 9 protein [Candidatus Limnocylindrales bacterium]|jgi:lipopolysaccharide heptosyltransferase I|nr:glycosyltransferase family 9 protein [Candidatus Limnocylindrales bacterium]
MAETTDRFLIVRLTSLGDLVHTIPAVGALRASFPQATIDWAVDEHYLPLIEMVTCIDETIPLGRSISDVLGCIGRLRRAHYTCALDLQGTYRSAVLTWLSGAPRRIGRTREATREPGAELFSNERVTPTGRHIVDMTVALAVRAGARPQPEPQFPLRVPENALRAAREKLARDGITVDYVVISPGGGWKSKCWPPERFGALAAELLRRDGLRSVVNIAPGEEELGAGIVQAAGLPAPPVVSVAIPELAALLAQARLVVAGDTGPLHLAAALGTRVVGLFGATNAERNGPLPRGLVLQNISCPPPEYIRGDYVRLNTYSEAMLSLSVEQVLAAVEQEIGVNA